MAQTLEELDYQKTPLGELVLRRRRSPSVPDDWVYEVTLDHEMLMSSTVNVSERALATLAFEAMDSPPRDVLVGGLGLGYTAAAALESPSVRRLVVVELLAPVIAWHRNRLVPMAATLIDDPRCSLVEADFFSLWQSGPNGQRYDAILLDIDHSPDALLDAGHAGFYSTAGLQALSESLQPGGVFALWSASKPSAEFLDAMAAVFAYVRSHEVAFFNPHVNEPDANWVLVATSTRPNVPPPNRTRSSASTFP